MSNGFSQRDRPIGIDLPADIGASSVMLKQRACAGYHRQMHFAHLTSQTSQNNQSISRLVRASCCKSAPQTDWCLVWFVCVRDPGFGIWVAGCECECESQQPELTKVEGEPASQPDSQIARHTASKQR